MQVQFPVSRTSLHRDFEEDGGLEHCIVRRRIETALDTLAAAPTGRGQILEVASSFGFKDPGHFSRPFVASWALDQTTSFPLRVACGQRASGALVLGIVHIALALVHRPPFPKHNVGPLGGGRSPPDLEAGKAVLDFVAFPVSVRVVWDGHLVAFSRRGARRSLLVLKGFTIPVGIVSAIYQYVYCGWQIAQRRPRSNAIAALPSRQEHPHGATDGIVDGMAFRVRPAFGAPDQASTPPFFKLFDPWV